MRTPKRTAFTTVVALVLLGWGTASRAQGVPDSPLDRIVRYSQPIPVGTGPWMIAVIMSLMTEVSVPFGFENVDALREDSVPNRTQRPPAPSALIPVRGLTLRGALDAIVAADPRFEWRDLGGVIVMRPIAAWNDPMHPLLRLVPAVWLDRVNEREAAAAIRAAIGRPVLYREEIVDDSPGKLFSVTFPGGSLLDLLNVVAAAHGELGWTLNQGLFFNNPFGSGAGLNGALEPPPAVLPAPVVMTGVHAESSPRRDSPLDRRLPPEMTHIAADSIPFLATRLGFSAGFEQAGALTVRASARFPSRGARELPDMHLPPGPDAFVAGMTLRQALNALVAVDRRYDWRDMDGVAVIRPVESWADHAHPLERTVVPAHFRDARVSEAFDLVSESLEPRQQRGSRPFGDEGRLSLDFSGGSLMDLLNAIVRGHGRLAWTVTSEAVPVPVSESHIAFLAEPAVGVRGTYGTSFLPLVPRTTPAQPQDAPAPPGR